MLLISFGIVKKELIDLMITVVRNGAHVSVFGKFCVI